MDAISLTHVVQLSKYASYMLNHKGTSTRRDHFKDYTSKYTTLSKVSQGKAWGNFTLNSINV